MGKVYTLNSTECITSDDVTAKKSNVLVGTKTITSDSSDAIVDGTMPDNSTCSSNGTVPGINSTYPNIPTREGTALQMGTDTSGAIRISIAPPQGYYSGNSYVNRPASDFGDASADKVLAGSTFTSSAGIKRAGTMANNATLNCGGSYAIPAGYHNGSGKVSANSLASQTSGATAEDKYVKKGLKYWKDGVLRTGTMEIQSALNFSIAASSYNTVRISWKNPSVGPWTGIIVKMSTSGNPGTGGGTEKYRGSGTNGSQANGNNYVDITGLNHNTKYYFTCASYIHYNNLNQDELGSVYNGTATTPLWWDTNSSDSMAFWLTPANFPSVLNDVDGKFKAMAWSDAGARAIANSPYALNAIGKNSRACMYMNMSAFVPNYYDTIVNSLSNTGYFDKKNGFSELSTSEQSSTGNYRSYVIYSAYPQGRASNNNTTWESSIGNDTGSIVVISSYKYGYNANTDPTRGYTGCGVSYYGSESYNGNSYNMVFNKGWYYNGESNSTLYTKYLNAGLKSTWDARFESKYWGNGRETFNKNIVCFGPAILDNSCNDQKSIVAYAYWSGNLYRCK